LEVYDGVLISALSRFVQFSIRRAAVGSLAVVCVVSAFALPPACAAQVNVVTQHNDIGRTGQNNSESILTPSNISNAKFGKLFTQPVDGQIYAQPLYMAGVTIPGSGVHNIVFVATEHDSVYAFDADSNAGADQSPLWKAGLLSPAYGAAPGATTVASATLSPDINPEYGITGTPVIDPVAGIIYVVSFTQEGASFVLRLHALNITTGAEMSGSPVQIQASIPGTGHGSTGGALTFNPEWENQRPGLLLLNGVVYVGFAAHGDNGPYHGWIMSYNATTLQQLAAYCNSANGSGSGFWNSGAGLTADVVDPIGHPFGRLFAVSGNGDYNATTPYTNAMDYGESIMNLDLTGGVPTIQDEFTPYNQASLTKVDGDVGSGGAVVLPNQTGNYPHLLAEEGKGGTIYLVNRDQMGGYSTTTDNVVQEVQSSVLQSGVWGQPTYWNGNLYVGEAHNHIKVYSLTGGVLSSAPTSTSAESSSYPGPGMSISSIGTRNGILWSIDTGAYGAGQPAILRAYNALNLASELYASNQVPWRDAAGPADKYMVPTISNGKVYVGAGGELDVYGSLTDEPTIASPVISPGPTSFSGTLQVTISDATPGSTIYYTADGSMPTTASAIYNGPLTLASTETITAIAVAPGYVRAPAVTATYIGLAQTAVPILSPAGGTFSASQTVTMSDANSGAAIYYTTDGSTPTAASNLYAGAITVAASETIQAIAIQSGLTTSAVATQSYIIQPGISFSDGFSLAQSSMTFNGSTDLDDSRLQLTNGLSSEAGSAFVTIPLNIQAFSTNFLIELSNAAADGITFTIEGDSPTALGGDSAALGFGPIPNSMAIKFDFYNDAGEGSDSTGVYINGASPTIPAINLSNSPINLSTGDVMNVQVAYDGANLAMTIVDTVTQGTWSGVWQENIPQIVGGNTAYIGFTGSSQALSASQKILTWTYQSLPPGQASSTATPVITPATGTYSGTQMVSIAESTSGAVVYYTTDGTIPTTMSNVYSGSFPVASSATIHAMAAVPGGAVSGAVSALLTVTSGAIGAVPTYPEGTGFSYGAMIMNGTTLAAAAEQANGNTTVVPSLELTDGSLNEARSAYFATPVNVQNFSSAFDFQLPNATGEGFTFVIQNTGLNAVGTALGYGFGSGGTGTAIGNSVALGFDLNGTAGNGANVVLLYLNGVPSTIPATNLTSNGLSLSSGDLINAQITYNGITLTVTLTDTVTNATVTAAYAVNIPATVGGNTAYVGFTGATSGTATATQNILDWVYVAGYQTPQTITFSGLPAAATYGSAGPYSLNATASSGLPVSFAVTGPASLSGTTLTLTGAGIVTVIASQTGNANYAAATAVTQSITVNSSQSQKTNPAAQLSSKSLNFGSVAYGATPTTLPLTVTNTGGGTLTVSTSINGLAYAISASSCGAGIGAGQSCVLTVEFKPSFVGKIPNTLTLTTNAGPALTVSLQGNLVGVAPIGTGLAYGSISLGTTSTLSISIADYGVAGPVTLSTSINGPSYKVVSSTCGSGLTAGSTCALQVEFDPVSAGSHVDKLTVTPSTGPAFNIQLAGTAM
jgi:hypothetical protein